MLDLHDAAARLVERSEPPVPASRDRTTLTDKTAYAVEAPSSRASSSSWSSR